MKKIFWAIALFSIFAGVLYSCTKEDVGLPSQNDGNNADIIKVINFPNAKGNITMLYFSSTALYDTTLSQLESQVSSYIDNYRSQYQTLNDSALFEQMIADDFLETQPLIDFENNYQFTNSLRKSYAAVMDEWLNHKVLDTLNDPDKKYVLSEEEMTLLNDHEEVMIGSSIYVITSRGVIEITDGDIPTLIRVREKDPTVFEEDNVISDVDGGGKGDDCVSWRTGYWWDTYSNGKKVKKKVSFHKYSWKVAWKAKIKSFKLYHSWLWG